MKEKIEVPTVNQNREVKDTVVRTTQTIITAKKIGELEEALSKIETAKEGVNLAKAYLTLESKGDEFRGCFLGFSKTEFKDKETGEYKGAQYTVELLGTDKRVYMNAGVSLVETFRDAVAERKLTPSDLVLIRLRDKVKAPKGYVYVYDVIPLYV